jgi:hypothetical protein
LFVFCLFSYNTVVDYTGVDYTGVDYTVVDDTVVGDDTGVLGLFHHLYK